jgi:hypothetical protein
MGTFRLNSLYAVLISVLLLGGLGIVTVAGAAPAHPKKHKPRCQKVRKGAHSPQRAKQVRRCKKAKPKPKPQLPVTVPAPTAPPVAAPAPAPSIPSGPGGLPAPLPEPEVPGDPGDPNGPGGPDPDPVPNPGPEFDRVDLISNNDFEDQSQVSSCFEPFSASEGKVAIDTTTPIAGARSLKVNVSPFGRVGCIHDYAFNSGPTGKTVTLESKLRIDKPATGTGLLKVCAIVYFANTQEPTNSCKNFVPNGRVPVAVKIVADVDGRQLQRVFFQLEATANAIEATLDDSHLVVESVKGSGGPGTPGGGGGDDGGDDEGGGSGSTGGRYAAIVSPTDGESFTAPLDLRLIGIGHDPNVFTNDPVPGKGTNSAKLEFFLDGVKVFEQSGTDAEYHVFKGFARGLNVAPGQHTVFSRATYVKPAQVIDSPPVTITVKAPTNYAQTVELSQDIVLSGSQSYELVGTPNGRIRLNGNGHRIVAPNGTSGDLVLKNVDVYGLGSAANTASPGIDVGVTSAAGSVTIENSIFDSSNGVDLNVNSNATASIKGNLFRSNMRTQIGQFPREEQDSPTLPLIEISGTSTAPKTFAGNNVAAGPVVFEDVNHWTIGGSTSAAGNILVGPRTAVEVLDSSDIAIEGNILNHNYYGGWSQGQLLELHGSRPISVKHNLLMDSSWPVRGIGGEFAYNLVVEAGHYWMVPDTGANVHHNVFVGGDNDVGGITGFYPISARIENNTFDGLKGPLTRVAINWQDGSTTLKSNAFLGFPKSGDGVIERTGLGSITADYNGFFNPETKNYVGLGAPTHDLNGGASTNPLFAGPLPTTTFDMDRVAMWQRTLPLSSILAAYRARYKPSAASPYVDAGDPSGGAGNDIGAIGAGAANGLDRFGIFAP